MPARRAGSFPIMRSMITSASLVFRPLEAFFFMSVNSRIGLELGFRPDGRPQVRVLDALFLATDHSEHDALGPVKEVEHPDLHAPHPTPQLVDSAAQVSRDRTAKFVAELTQLVDQRHDSVEPPDIPEAVRLHPLHDGDPTPRVLEEDDPDRRQACLPFYRNLAIPATRAPRRSRTRGTSTMRTSSSSSRARRRSRASPLAL